MTRLVHRKYVLRDRDKQEVRANDQNGQTDRKQQNDRQNTDDR